MSKLNTKSIETLIALMQREGVMRIKTADIELELAPAAVFKGAESVEPVLPPEPPKFASETVTVDGITIPLALAWSMPGLNSDGDQ